MQLRIERQEFCFLIFELVVGSSNFMLDSGPYSLFGMFIQVNDMCSYLKTYKQTSFLQFWKTYKQGVCGSGGLLDNSPVDLFSLLVAGGSGG